ncbi:hypothetical protein DSO57_1034748 [Entomophthora muscae]|uniref:Uncharacterized protein n=1 Tax=Entomophthora muscae TaxID=34485 RepID=A0ACC2U9K1_9FUNG|nr:hypothetical protein DSO57_1034748 [Entomophthora muscae]
MHTRPARKKRQHKAALLACDQCQLRKVRCIAATVGGQCQSCVTRGKVCTYMNPTLRSIKLKTSPSFQTPIEAIFTPRRSSLLEGEQDDIVRFFRLVDLPEVRALKEALPQLVAQTSHTEFRFLVHTILAALFFKLDSHLSQVSPKAIHNYAASVDHLLLNEASSNPQLMALIFSLLETVKSWASFIVSKN